MKRQTVILFYVLSIYIILQFSWWAFYLYELSSLAETPDIVEKRILMIVGEGIVFFLILLLGLFRIRSAIQKEIKISKQQNNFLLSVTHELKTPLASVKLLLQTLLKRKELSTEQQIDIIQQAIQENKRLEDMIENILIATRIDGEELNLSDERIHLSEEFYRIVDAWQGKRVAIQMNIEPDIYAKMDVFILKTILHNLLENSFKYVGKEPEIEVYLKQDDGCVVFGVKDNGNGIPEEYKIEIFNKFVRIGNEEIRDQKGTGLGLYIVKKMIAHYGGTIVCLDNIPKGADFKITLRNDK
ncbi:MAG: HAMP domain-containing histidine kinase [Brumimicrobium sp.]|nr:HAMP domain-containing histidine kinase [Brumimicrobium sp.]MCO5269409.1 HAMP domain-containing histidine kinase [Brumimicrobium sp.]